MSKTSNTNSKRHFDNRPIGVFDSGMGGLTVLKQLKVKLPHESFIYLGDTARLPYGTKSQDTICQYANQAVQQLLDRNVKMIIIACNSATVSSLHYLQDKYQTLPLLGVVQPGAIASARATQTNHIGIIATERTVLSGCYEASLKNINPDFKVFAKQCNIFASLAEEGHISDDIAKLVINIYLQQLIVENPLIDTLLLGCTHFPVFNQIIKEQISDTISIVDSAECTSEYANKLLLECELACDQKQVAKIDYFVTDSPDRFKKIGQHFLGQPIDNISLI